MNAVPQILKANKSDHITLIEIWEASVRATHHFLTEEDIQYYKKQILEQYFDVVELYLLKTAEEQTAGFIGMSPGKVEMLFVDPAFFRRGFGAILLDYAIKQHGVTKVDVNEDNGDALRFYLHKGFRVGNRMEKDGEGRDFPILQLVKDPLILAERREHK